MVVLSFYLLLNLSLPPGARALTPQRNTITSEEKQVYEDALRSIRKEDWDEGLLRMEHFVRYFHESPLADNAIFWMAEIYLQKEEINLARDELHRIIRDYPAGDRAKRALGLLDSLNVRRPK